MSARSPVERPRRALYTAAYWSPFVLGGLLMVPILYVLVTAIGSSGEPTPA